MVAFTQNLRLTLQDTGSNDGIWGDVANTQVFQFAEDAIAGIISKAMTNGVNTLSSITAQTDEARKAVVVLTGLLTTAASINAPGGAEKLYLVHNTTTGGQDVTIQISGGGGLAVLLPQTGAIWVYTDGTDFFEIAVSNSDTATLATSSLDSDALGGVAAASYARLDIQQGFSRAQDTGRSPIVPSGPNLDVNASLSNSFYVSMTGNFNLINPTNGRDGQVIRFIFVQDGTGGRTLQFGSQFIFPGGNVPILSTGINAIDYAGFEFRQAAPGPFWIGNLAKDFGN
jgi:hypothetical protein